MRLTEDQKDQLRELLASQSWDALMAVSDIILEDFAKGVLTCDVSQNSRRLLIEKLRLEGATAFSRALRDLKKKLKE